MDSDIVRNEDGSLVVPLVPDRHAVEDLIEQSAEIKNEAQALDAAATTRVIHPGEGGYDEALSEWDRQQNPDREAAVSTASGREQAMAVVHAVAESEDHDVDAAVEAVDDPEASAEALRHVLVGGVHSVEDFASEVAEAEGGEPLPPHEATKIIGEVLAELD